MKPLLTEKLLRLMKSSGDKKLYAISENTNNKYVSTEMEKIYYPSNGKMSIKIDLYFSLQITLCKTSNAVLIFITI